MKRFIAALLAAVLLILSISCGKGGASRVSNVFRSEEIALPDGFALDRILRAPDGFILTSEYDDDGEVSVLHMDKSFSVTDMNEKLPSKAVAFLPDGSAVFSEGGGVRITGTRELFVNYQKITDVSGTGGNYESGVSPYLSDFDGNILFIGQFKALLTDSDLEKIGDIPLSGSVESFDLSPDGRIMISTRDKMTGKGEIGFVEPKTGRYAEAFSVPEELSSFGATLFAGADGKAYLKCSTGIYLCRNGQGTYLCDFINSDIISSRVGDMCFLDDDRFLMIYDGGLLLMTHVPDSEVEPRELIEIAGINIPDYLSEAAVDFNRSSDEYRVVLKDYDIYGGSSGELMRNDIISGKIPDIMVFDSNPNYENYHDEYIRQRMFADLWEFIDAEGYPDRGDLLGGLVLSGERDGKLYELITWACMEYFTTTEPSVPADGWTLREFLDWGKAYEGSIISSRYTTRNDLLYYMLCCSMGEFVDEDEGVCDFDTPLFREAMEFAKDCRLGSSDNALRYGIIDGVQLWYNNKRSTAKGSDTRIVGFPSDSGNGIRVSGSGISISAKSDVKEAAWSFIETLIPMLGTREDTGEFGVTRQSIKNGIECVMKKDSYVYYYGADGSEKRVASGEYTPGMFDETKGKVVLLDESDEKYLTELLDGAGKSISRQSKLWAIIEEEAEVYFAGAKTLDETVKIIQSRASAYVSERS